MESPKITIVSITFNNLKGLIKTLQSVCILNYLEIEHIVIDGKSSDGTVEYLKDYTEHPITFISEEDEGIYDAMNKGIELASGEWIIFMNAGDCFYQPDIFSNLHLNSIYEIIYGNSEVIYENGYQRIQLADDIHSLWKGMSFTHQAVLTKTSLMKKEGFDINYKFCSDFNFLYGHYLKGIAFQKVDMTIATIEAGGISDSERYKATNEVFRINRRLNNKAKLYFYFPAKIIYSFIVVNIKSILPSSTKKALLKRKYK